MIFAEANPSTEMASARIEFEKFENLSWIQTQSI
jgi:hypothetical protein